MFGKRLRLLRKNHNLNTHHMAGLLDIGKSSYAAYETERRKPPLETIILLAEYYQVDTDYILGLKDNPSQQIIDLNATTEITWDGIPLTEDELKPIKEILEMIVRNRMPHNN